MIIVNILGGLGNQMFQYACGYVLAKRKNMQLKLDITSFENYSLRKYELDKFNIDVEYASRNEIHQLKYKDITFVEKFIRKLTKKNIPFSMYYYNELYFHFDPALFDKEGSLYIDGYWQSEKYFIAYRNELLRAFSLKDKLTLESETYRKKIEEAESASLHIRRGDYVTNTQTNSVHGTCSLEYYQEAVEKLQNLHKNTCFFIFSDDLNWAKDNLTFVSNPIFVELHSDTPDHDEMYLMSLCKHNIIANSSFSWWGAWLNTNSSKIVIAPKKWFNDISINTNDLIPESWLCL